MSDRRSHAGESNGRAKLTKEDVLAIRAIHNRETSVAWVGKRATQTALAEVFGVSQKTVSYILARKSWSHL